MATFSCTTCGAPVRTEQVAERWAGVRLKPHDVPVACTNPRCPNSDPTVLRSAEWARRD